MRCASRGSAYSATKGALEALTRAWSAEFGARGVRVVGISPGVMLAQDHPASALMRGTPAGKPGAAAAIGDAAVFLASAEASFVHDTILDVDGGRTSVAVVDSGARLKPPQPRRTSGAELSDSTLIGAGRERAHSARFEAAARTRG